MTAYAPTEPWLHPPADALERLEMLLERVLGSPATVFFRADDIGLPSAGFARMLETFVRHETPLALAVVPAWLPMRHADFERQVTPGGSLWCLHQHGFRHMNHEPEGRKKSEFGQARPAKAKQKDVSKGLDILEHYLGDRLVPLFTPPWNRCDGETLEALSDLGFDAVSRGAGARPSLPGKLAELPVNVDLHTRKESTAEDALSALLMELEQGLASGMCGIMLHHQRMNRAATEFLDRMLSVLGQSGRLAVTHPADLIP